MSVGTYVDTDGLKLRVWGPNETDVTQDTLLGDICAETNDFIEQFTGRVLAPVPAYSSTFTGTVGSTTATVGSAAGLSVGDDLLLGLLDGNHEATTVIGIAGNALTLNTPLTFSYVAAPVQRIAIMDGFDAFAGQDGLYGRALLYPRGLITLAALEVATFTNGPFSRIPNTDFFLRPALNSPDAQPGWPFTEVWMTNIPRPGNTSPVFYPGYGNIRLIGPGPCLGTAAAPFLGWPTVLDSAVQVAYNIATQRWAMRNSGGTYDVTPGIDVTQVGSFLINRVDYGTLLRLRAKTLGIV